MTRYLLIVVCAFALAAGLTPMARSAAFRLGWVAQPAPRKLHKRTMPLLGGAAIYIAFIAALTIVGDRFYVRQAVGILVGATLCSFLGLWDDRVSLPPWAKLLGQLLAALILILTGVQVQLWHLQALNVLVTLLWVLGITNAMNLLDNMDGLSGGVGAVASAFFLLLAAGSGQYLVGFLAAALLGACIGFLVYNVNPASIFMGDSGSLFLGYMLAAVGIKLRFPDNV
ncbi:MAG: undecaprenyl/decaprenyl-phosphate alpha-N-acetylglucosaminyl 1-phosphate transferase, partial [Chloroflexi bacterium]|nr:undecaprenyl/decaprenyl-phosphate alpha-N-acetylglucosaminyl 1-phosphate transferase [Chloroflexota bacterium]